MFLAKIARLDDAARRIARGFRAVICFGFRKTVRTALLARSAVLAVPADDPLDSGTIDDIAKRLAEGCFRPQAIASGVVSATSLSQARSVQQGLEIADASVVSGAQQFEARVLRKPGHDEADLLSAQGADTISHPRTGRAGDGSVCQQMPMERMLPASRGPRSVLEDGSFPERFPSYASSDGVSPSWSRSNSRLICPGCSANIRRSPRLARRRSS